MKRWRGSRIKNTRRADWFWLSQVSLALSALLLVSGLGLARYAALARQVVVLCQRTAQELALHGWMTLLLIPPALGTLSLVLVGLSVARQLWITRRLLQRLGPTRPLSPELAVLAQRLGLSGRVCLAADPQPMAFCVGLVRPVVWLTTGLVAALNQDELVAVLRHEGHHLRHRDPLKLLLVRAVASAFFFLPVVRELGRAYQVHKELAADAEAVVAPAGQIGLARALLKLLARDTGGLDEAVVGSLIPDRGDGTAEARLRRLTEGAAPKLRLRRRSLVLTGLALLLFLVVGLSPLERSTRADWGGSCDMGSEGRVVLWLDAR